MVWCGFHKVIVIDINYFISFKLSFMFYGSLLRQYLSAVRSQHRDLQLTKQRILVYALSWKCIWIVSKTDYNNTIYHLFIYHYIYPLLLCVAVLIHKTPFSPKEWCGACFRDVSTADQHKTGDIRSLRTE